MCITVYDGFQQFMVTSGFSLIFIRVGGLAIQDTHVVSFNFEIPRTRRNPVRIPPTYM